MSGLIDRVIWVWPDWDWSNHGNSIEYGMDTLSLGWVYVGKGPHKSRAFCMCEKNETRLLCNSMSDTGHGYALDDEQDVFNVPVEDCVILKTLIVEEVHESSALVNFGKPDWLAKDESIILDIDEDFFGCTYAVQPIVDSGLSMERLLKIDDILHINLCPRNSSHERESDTFLMKLIDTIRKKRACAIDPTLKDSDTCKRVTDVDPVSYFDKMLKNLIAKQFMTPCSGPHAQTPSQFIRSFITEVSKLRIQQLHAFQTVGFCASTSPKSYTLSRGERKFGLCYGANTPDNTAVLEHNPTQEEVTRRSVILRGILKKLSARKPGLVTVSRSMRDGYTPRNYFETIEKSILTSLNSTMGRPIHLHYDIDLLGGKRGWPSRHKA